MKKKFGFWKIVRKVMLAVMGVFLVWILGNQILTAYEKDNYPAPGQKVKIDGKYMHVYTKGDGQNTIVLLSGLGTAAPVLDFKPLINELSKNNKVVVVEPFGYGWSDLTNKERTAQNIVEEIRLALNKANIKAPYILMPHSVSGIYSMYFVNKYPDEIKAVIGINPTLPRMLEYFGEDAPTIPKFMRLLAPTGIARLAVYMTPEDFLPIADKDTYSDKNLEMTKRISAWKGYNKTFVAEANEIKSNMEETFDMSFPKDLPVMIFASKNEKVRADEKSVMTFYETYLHNLTSKRLVAFEGHHYLHWDRYREMSKYVNDFLSGL